MAFDLKNIELKFSGPDDDVLGDFIREIANGGLGTYRRIIQDVYKRQRQYLAMFVNLLAAQHDALDPVSYTHLDVYKRQR